MVTIVARRAKNGKKVWRVNRMGERRWFCNLEKAMRWAMKVWDRWDVEWEANF